MLALIVFAITLVTLSVRVGFGPGVAAPWLQLGIAAYFALFAELIARLQLDVSKLRVAEVVFISTSGLLCALLPFAIPGLAQESRELIFQLSSSQVLMLRSSVVPSSAQRTLWLSGITILPGIALCVVGRWGAGAPLYAAVPEMLIRCAAPVIAGALVSRRIYGLERQVAEARRLGQYTLQEKIGAGGMGVVYRARHALLRRPTAIKLVHPQHVGAQALARFEREVQLTSQLTHPSTIQIYDFGRNESGVFYYAMEYLDGLTLREFIDFAGPQPASRVIQILVQICGSLAEAHAVGLVHRDIKPANIMLCERGQIADVAKLLDFGLARLRGEALSPEESGFSTIAGTPGYIPPEAVTDAANFDCRSDIYALGAVGYFLVTGQPVFAAPSFLSVLWQQLHETPVPPTLRLGAHVPPDLEALLLSCLATDVLGRPQSARELRQRLLGCKAAMDWSPADAEFWWATYRDELRAHLRQRGAAAPSIDTGALILGHERAVGWSLPCERAAALAQGNQ